MPVTIEEMNQTVKETAVKHFKESLEERIREELFDEYYEIKDFITEVERTIRDQDTRVDLLRALYRRQTQLEDELEINKWNG